LLQNMPPTGPGESETHYRKVAITKNINFRGDASLGAYLCVLIN